MSRIAYVDGIYVPHGSAAVHIEDRGYQFADGVYEVIAVVGGRRIDDDNHFERLERSLGELGIPMPMSRRPMSMVMDEVVRRNRVDHGILYLQVTRGAARREHAWPRVSRPVLTITARRQPPPGAELVARGVAVITIPDMRWKRNDIKSISLVANVLGKQTAREAGAYEAWMLDGEGNVTEGTSTTAWIVTAAGEIVTRPLDNAILSGVTRTAILEIARAAKLPVVERAFSPTEAVAAKEAFLTSTSSYVMQIISIDDRRVGDGRPGSVTLDLLKRYNQRIQPVNYS